MHPTRKNPSPIGKSTRRTFRASETMKTPKRSILVDRANRVPPAGNKVKFRLDDADNSRIRENITKSYVPSKRPLLGYDWIAGMVDLRTSSIASTREHALDGDYLEEIDQFRKANREECSSKVAEQWNQSRFSPVVTPHKRHFSSPDPNDSTDTRIHDFTVNSRLFPVAISGDTESIRPGTATSPRFIRISVPKSVLTTPQKFKKPVSHDADSMALHDHCMLGRQYSVSRGKQSKARRVPHLDLKSSLHPRPGSDDRGGFVTSYSSMVSLPPSLLGSYSG